MFEDRGYKSIFNGAIGSIKAAFPNSDSTVKYIRAQLSSNFYHYNGIWCKGNSFVHFFGKDSLGTYCSSDDINKITVCFMKIDNVEIFKKDFFIMNVVETYRKKGFLYLKSGNEDILKVTKRK